MMTFYPLLETHSLKPSQFTEQGLNRNPWSGTYQKGVFLIVAVPLVMGTWLEAADTAAACKYITLFGVTDLYLFYRMLVP